MNYKAYKATQFKPIRWSGGSTTELYISPGNSDYKQLDFDFRLSTATVEIESSVFTPLPGVSRTLMVLEGEMTLNHEHHHSTTLLPFDVDNFEGGWTTHSQGQCIDFNLMCIGNTSGSLKGLKIKREEKTMIHVDVSVNQLFIYLYKGYIIINPDDESINLEEGSVFALEEVTSQDLTVLAESSSQMVICQINSKA